MRLENAVADVYSYRGAQYGFCSDYCKDEFAKDPEKYLTKLSENKP
ncbi:MAG: YHS domain-containing protein [Candidatus Hydrogenedentes bacterium]|nr:YHS domain-containing protein [Candidatus Hydrogenedentota bacterium]